WDGLMDNGRPVTLGLYTCSIDAVDPDPMSKDAAIERTQTLAVTSLATGGQDPKALFEKNAYVYPNPIRVGQGTFQFEAVRDGASISLKIYTLTGDLVRSEEFTLPTGALGTFIWDATNQAGRKVGRGLYYYVLRETDSQGTLQVVKKVAVIQ